MAMRAPPAGAIQARPQRGERPSQRCHGFRAADSLSLSSLRSPLSSLRRACVRAGLRSHQAGSAVRGVACRRAPGGAAPPPLVNRAAARSRHSDGLALRHAGHVLRHLAAVHDWRHRMRHRVRRCWLSEAGRGGGAAGLAVLVDAALVGLEHELDLAEVPVARHRRVHPVDLSLVRRHVLPPIPLASHLADDVRSEDLEVLAGGQAEHGRGLGQREGEVQRVVRYVLLLRQRQLLPLLVEELLLSSASHEEHCEQQHGEADDHRHHRHRHQLRTQRSAVRVSSSGGPHINEATAARTASALMDLEFRRWSSAAGRRVERTTSAARAMLCSTCGQTYQHSALAARITQRSSPE
eukprot:scaffold24493_cov61-Phaeocystis_antarctica.AAC.2